VDSKRFWNDSIAQFVLLTYAVTWACSAIGLTLGIATSGLWVLLSSALLILGSMAPSVVALGLTVLREGTCGSRALLRHLFDWRVNVGWYVFSFFYPVAILLAANVGHRVITGEWVPLSHPRWFTFVSSTILLLPVRASEEIGWRGYALPRLAKRFGLAKAGLILGPIWACWHLPLFLIPGMGAYGGSAPMFVLGVTALSVAFAWLYGNTNGSLLLVILLHSAIDEVFILLPKPMTVANSFAFVSELMPWLITAFECLIAGCILALMLRTPSAETSVSIPRFPRSISRS
jgi:membrane protease YdiL (CAAX protease family)